MVFNGSRGRIEMKLVEKSYVNGGSKKSDEGALRGCEIKVFPMFDEPYVVPVVQGIGGHGGGDNVMLRDLFGISEPDPLNRAADYQDGALSILTGIAANRSLRTELPVRINDLAVKLPPRK